MAQTKWIYDTAYMMRRAHEMAKVDSNRLKNYRQKFSAALKYQWGQARKALRAALEKEQSRSAIRSVPASAVRPATPKQLEYLGKLARRLDRVEMFDSFSGTGRQAATEIRSKSRNRLSMEDASSLIDWAIDLLDDAM